MYWTPVILYALVIFILSSQPSVPQPPGAARMPYLNYFEHLIEYACFGALLYLALTNSKNITLFKFAIPLAILIGGLYGITDEIHQAFVPNRYPEIADVVTDFLGSAVGAILVWTIPRFKKSDDDGR